MKKEQEQQVSTEASNVLYTLLCGVFSTSEEKPTHFKMVRVASSLLIELIPEEWISDYHLDYHLDSYCLYFYKDNKELFTKVWWGVEKRGFIENKIYPLCELKCHITFGGWRSLPTLINR